MPIKIENACGIKKFEIACDISTIKINANFPQDKRHVYLWLENVFLMQNFDKVCHGFRLMKRADSFESILTTFEVSIVFLRQLGQ